MPSTDRDGAALPHPSYLLLGEVLRPHGIRGELRLRVLTDFPERVGHLKTVFIGTDPTAPAATPYTVESMRMHKTYMLLKLQGIDDRTQADTLRQLFVMVDLANAVPLADDEVYLFQIIGLNVQTEDGETLGQVTDVLETGANDVYVVGSERYGEVLIPDIEETILKLDPDQGLMIVRLLEGLLPPA